MAKERTLILNAAQIQAKLDRIARELLESAYQDKEIMLVGVADKGIEVARRLGKILSALSDKTIDVRSIALNKDKPLSGAITFDGSTQDLRNKNVVLVDDVLNSGRTLIYCVRHLLETEPKRLSTVVLVDRFHRRFPIRADYVGLSLSTNVKEHITVELGNEEGVYLS